MRNIKVLWGVNVVLLTATLLLGAMLLNRSDKDGAVPQSSPTPGVQQRDQPIARIGGQDITRRVLDSRLYEKYGAELLEEMLEREAVRLEADELRIKITGEEIDRELKRMQKGYDSEAQFYESMQAQLGLSKAELREDVYYKLLLDAIATSSVKVTEDEIDKYIAEHPDEFRIKRQLHLLMILNDSLQQANRTIELWQNGTPFGQLASERSLDPVTAAEGGDLGWVEEDDPFLEQVILEEAKKLKAGSISKPIRVHDGYAVVMLKDIKEGGTLPEGEARDTVRKQLALQKAPSLNEVVRSLRIKWKAEIFVPELKS